MDSCWLGGINLGIGNDGRSDPTPYEFLGVGLIQKPSDKTIHEEINWGFFFSKSRIQVKGPQIINGIEPQLLPVENFSYPILKDSNSYLNVFTLATNTFLSVYRVSFNHYGGNATYLFNDSVGYIKMVVNYEEKYRIGDSISTVKINEVWELQRWHVIK